MYECCTVETGRRFLTRDEKVKMMEEYREALENELKGVTEKINELKKK